MIGRLRQLSEPWLRQQAGIEKSQTSVERGIFVKWVRKGKDKVIGKQSHFSSCLYTFYRSLKRHKAGPRSAIGRAPDS